MKEIFFLPAAGILRHSEELRLHLEEDMVAVGILPEVVGAVPAVGILPAISDLLSHAVYPYGYYYLRRISLRRITLGWVLRISLLRLITL